MIAKAISACGRLHGIFKKAPSYNPTTTKATVTRAIPNTKPTKLKNPAANASAAATTGGYTTTTTKERRGPLDKMVEKFKKSSQSSIFRARYDIYENTVRRLIKYNRFSMIHEILDYQKKFPDITNEPFTAHLICLYGKAGMFDRAQKLFDEMPELNCPSTVYSFNALLSACIDAGRFDEIKKIVVGLRHELGITLNVVSYNIAIKGFCKMGDLESAERVVDEMVNRDVEPDLITFNTLLNGFYLNGKFVDGERIWCRMMEMNIVPDVRSYNAKLNGLALEKRMNDAVELVEEMRAKDIKLDVFSYNGLIRGFVNGENLEEAKWWYGDMIRCNCAPDKVTFDILIPFLCEKDDLGYAVEICEEFFSRKLSVSPEAMQLVVDALVREAKNEEAEKLVRLAKRFAIL